MYVPIDDESAIKWQIRWYPTRSLMESTKETVGLGFDEERYDPPTNCVPFGHIRAKAKKSNDYLID